MLPPIVTTLPLEKELLVLRLNQEVDACDNVETLRIALKHAIEQGEIYKTNIANLVKAYVVKP
jgi:hypothetical protein